MARRSGLWLGLIAAAIVVLSGCGGTGAPSASVTSTFPPTASPAAIAPVASATPISSPTESPVVYAFT